MSRRVAGPLAISLVFLLAAEVGALADLRPPARPRDDAPMRIVRVVSSDPACKPDCPEWISAEGRIVPGTAQSFAQLLGDLRGRRLPVLVHSRGGAVVDAIAIGRLIRSSRLAVAVARTLISNCAEQAPTCAGAQGRPFTGGAKCASACVLILAGGVERLVSFGAMVGVHQMTTIVKEVEGAAHLTTTKKVYEQIWADVNVQNYLSAMGVGDPVMTLMRRTPAASIHWLSAAEIRESRLATLALDNAAPVLTTGANGLNGYAVADAAPRPNLVVARVAAPFALPALDREMLETTFAYRRGGGVVEATLEAREGDENTPTGPQMTAWTLTLSADSGEPLELRAAGAPPRTLIPRERFCALARGGRLTAAPLGSPETGDKLRAVLDAVDMVGASTVVDEACP